MRITTVIEDESHSSGVSAEHGLCFYVTTAGGSFVVDGGASGKTVSNFKKLNIDSRTIKAAVLSHNHYDHIGGFPELSRLFNDDVKIYASSEIYSETVKVLSDGEVVKLSDSEALNALSARLKLVYDIETILPNVYVCRVEYPVSFYFCQDKRLKRRINGQTEADDFAHEIYVAAVENGECKIISPCSHNGVVNIVRDAAERFKGCAVTAFCGGLHLAAKNECGLNCEKEFVEEIVSILNGVGLKELVTCHCTGRTAFEIIKSKADFKVSYISSGDEIII